MKTSGFISATGSNIPFPKFSGSLPNRLIPQPGIRQIRDSVWQTDQISVPYRIGRQYVSDYAFPEQYSPHPGFGKNMVLDSIEITHGPVIADVVFNYRGISDGRIPDLSPEDSTSLQSMQINDPGSGAVADVAFYQPQTIWRFVTLGYPQRTPYTSINDPYLYRKAKPIRYAIRTDPGAPPSDLTGIVRDDQLSFVAERWGMFYRNTLVIVRRYTSPFTS